MIKYWNLQWLQLSNMALKHGRSEKVVENLPDVFQRNCLRFCSGYPTDWSYFKQLYEKFGLIPLSKAVMRESLRWLGYVLPMKDDRLRKIDFEKYMKEIGASWEGVKSAALNRLGWRRSAHSCVGLRWLGVALSC